MTLNLKNGNFTPHIRWMASTSTWRKSTDDEPEDVTLKHAVFDLANIQTGWAVFEKGEPPEWVMDGSIDQKAPRPQDRREWKRGFKLNIFSGVALDGVREFATTATGACLGIQKLHDQFEAEASNHSGKVPVVQYDGATPTRIGKGNTNVPNFSIVKWADRPDGLAPKPSNGQAQRPKKQDASALPALDDEIRY